MQESKKDRKYYYSINTLRFLFICAIVLFHVHVYFGKPYYSVLGPICRQGGSFGNIWFFITSGFLIALTYDFNLKNAESIDFKTFATKRMRSIYPLYFISNVVQIVLSAILNGFESIDFSRVVLSLIFVSEGWIGTTQPYNFPTWFVCVLVISYLIYYVIYRFSNSKTCYLCMIAIAIIWGYYCKSKQLDFPFCYSATGSAVFYFFTGCALKEVIELKKESKKYIYTIWFILFGILCWYSLQYGFTKAGSDIGVVIAFIIMPCVIIVCHEVDVLNRICSKKLLKHLGDISMHVFFWHIPVWTLFKALTSRAHLDPENAWMMAIYFVALICVAELSSMCIKRNKHGTI